MSFEKQFKTISQNIESLSKNQLFNCSTEQKGSLPLQTQYSSTKCRVGPHSSPLPPNSVTGTIILSQHLTAH